MQDLGEELGVPVLHIHRLMIMRAADDSDIPIDQLPGTLFAPPCPALAKYLPDGLHFSGEGYRLLSEALMELIESH